MSKCFRASGGRLSCLTCHNLHSQPPEALAPSVFRQKCLTCHTEQNCTAPRSDRLATTPADNCVGCHMARRNNERIPHAMLSEHRIVRRAGEPFPDEVYRQTTPDLPDIVWVNRPNRAGATALDADTVTAAYGLLAERFPQYRKLFLERVLPRLADTAHSLSEPLLEAAARQAAQNGDASGDRLAIATMQKAIAMGVTSSSTYLDLAALLKRDHLFDDAVRVLEKAQEQFPFDRGVSRSLIDAYGLAGRQTERQTAVRHHLQLFPEDTDRFKVL